MQIGLTNKQLPKKGCKVKNCLSSLFLPVMSNFFVKLSEALFFFVKCYIFVSINVYSLI